MRRPPFPTFALFLTVLALPSCPATALEDQVRPNVLFIAVDDMRAELGCLGAAHIHSPNIDSLARRGVLFTRAYCQQAVCNPSRASFLTGLRPESLGIWDLPTHFRQRRPDIITLPQFFKNAGYHTEGIGKIFHNWRQDKFKGDPASWSVPAVLHYDSHANDKPQVEGPLPPNLSSIPKCEIRDVPDEAYFDGRIANLATAALRRLARSDDPFFLAVGFWKPHSHFNAPKKYWDLYARSSIKPPKNPAHPKNVPQIALHDGREIMRDFKSRPGGVPTPDDEIALRHGYYAAISYVDAQVGKVIRELYRLELAENTVIVFCSDHGFHLGENGLWAKTSNFELDARVPLIIATPNRKNAGATTFSLAELLDLYPTLCDLSGLPAPAHLEGKSLVPILNDPNSTVKDAAFTSHPRPAYPAEGEDPEAMGYSLRTARFRYTEWRNYADGKIIAHELYDHAKDPDETTNIAPDPNMATVVAALSADLAAWHPSKSTSSPAPSPLTIPTP